jgi:spore coat protein CotH
MINISKPIRTRLCAGPALLLGVVLLSGCRSPEEEETGEEAKGNFAPDHMVQVDIQMDEDDWETLRNQYRNFTTELVGADCMSEPFSADYTTFSADVVIDGESAKNVGIRKKGFIGSQSKVKPGLKINVDEWEEGAELFGVDNITLNNSVQDPSLIKQCIGYDLFAKAGLPASQCNFAHVTVNGKDMGVYVHVEPVKPAFLRKHFENDDGDLYEGTLSDFHPLKVLTFDSKTPETDASLAPIKALSDALAKRDDPLLDILNQHINLDQYFSFWAMETIIGHWDGYNGDNTNNFYVYRDSVTNRFSFIPWGIDGTLYPEMFEDEDEDEGFSLVPTGSVLATAILRSNTLYEPYYDRLQELLDEVWDEDAIIAEIDRMEVLVGTVIDGSDIAKEIESIRTYVWGLRDAINFITHEKPDKASNPGCMTEIGSLDASFETEWDSFLPASLHQNSSVGEAEMEVVWDGYNVPFSEVGAAAGEDEEDWATLLLSGLMDDGQDTYIMPYFSFPLESAVPGASLPIDMTTLSAGLLYTGPDLDYAPVQAAWILGGSLDFEEFQPTAGGVIRGTVSTKIHTWEELE